MREELTLGQLMEIYSIPNRKLDKLLALHSYDDIEDFILFKHNYSSIIVGSKHMKYFLDRYVELRKSGISHYKCKIII